MFEERTLGYKIDLKGKKLNDLEAEEFYGVMSKLWKHGVICIKNQGDLSKSEFLECVSRIGSPIRLHPFVSFNNNDPEYPEIIRVGNISLNNEVRMNFKGAEYWHADGDFWPFPKNFITNWLLSVEVPSAGGETLFLDTQSIYDSMSEEEKKYLGDTKFDVNLDEIEDFKGNDLNELGYQKVVNHDAVIVHPVNMKPTLYLGSYVSNLKYPCGKKEKAEILIEKYSSLFPVYSHKWEKGDLVIWDNLQVLHKGKGGYGNNRRLLLRGQSRVTPFFIDVLRKFNF